MLKIFKISIVLLLLCAVSLQAKGKKPDWVEDLPDWVLSPKSSYQEIIALGISSPWPGEPEKARAQADEKAQMMLSATLFFRTDSLFSKLEIVNNRFKENIGASDGDNEINKTDKQIFRLTGRGILDPVCFSIIKRAMIGDSIAISMASLKLTSPVKWIPKTNKKYDSFLFRSFIETIGAENGEYNCFLQWVYRMKEGVTKSYNEITGSGTPSGLSYHQYGSLYTQVPLDTTIQSDSLLFRNKIPFSEPGTANDYILINDPRAFEAAYLSSWIESVRILAITPEGQAADYWNVQENWIAEKTISDSYTITDVLQGVFGNFRRSSMIKSFSDGESYMQTAILKLIFNAPLDAQQTALSYTGTSIFSDPDGVRFKANFDLRKLSP